MENIKVVDHSLEAYPVADPEAYPEAYPDGLSGLSGNLLSWGSDF